MELDEAIVTFLPSIFFYYLALRVFDGFDIISSYHSGVMRVRHVELKFIILALILLSKCSLG